jgi:hypothetical protein
MKLLLREVWLAPTNLSPTLADLRHHLGIP